MTRHDPGVTIRQLLDHARGLLEIAQGRERSHLDTDRTFQWAVLRGLEVLGEAARRLPSDFHTRYPAIPWQNLIGMRNRLIHAYENVNMDIVWSVIRDRLPAIVLELEGILPDWPLPED
jgi:uncharacterized protein with HEPN domain